MELESVHSPLGGDTQKQQALSPPLADLNGKTVGESWNGDFKGDITFPLIRRLLKARYPSIRIVPFNELPYVHGADNPAEQKELAKSIARRAKELGCDALISGNGA